MKFTASELAIKLGLNPVSFFNKKTQKGDLKRIVLRAEKNSGVSARFGMFQKLTALKPTTVKVGDTIVVAIFTRSTFEKKKVEIPVFGTD